ncbi:hypothetical protein FGB62_21g418 [Gracilaria domingensis]|nr:hypothetical protein FGB62_21g418 [Gracilaria domingensis]
MGPGGLFARVAQWLANEIIVKGLANNPAFQRFAVRSSQQAKELSKSAAEAAKNISENVFCPSQIRCRFNLTTLLISLRIQESEAFRNQAKDFASALREEIEESVRRAGQGKDSQAPPTRK